MRHRKSGRHLNRTSAHRKAMFSNMAASLIEHEVIRTTTVKAKELRRTIEPLITLAKEDSVANRRLAFSRLRSKSAVGKLFTDLGPRYQSRPGGYTRILKAGYRSGDATMVAYIELVGRPRPDYDEDQDVDADQVATPAPAAVADDTIEEQAAPIEDSQADEATTSNQVESEDAEEAKASETEESVEVEEESLDTQEDSETQDAIEQESEETESTDESPEVEDAETEESQESDDTKSDDKPEKS